MKPKNTGNKFRGFKVDDDQVRELISDVEVGAYQSGLDAVIVSVSYQANEPTNRYPGSTVTQRVTKEAELEVTDTSSLTRLAGSSVEVMINRFIYLSQECLRLVEDANTASTVDEFRIKGEEAKQLGEALQCFLMQIENTGIKSKSKPKTKSKAKKKTKRQSKSK